MIWPWQTDRFFSDLDDNFTRLTKEMLDGLDARHGVHITNNDGHIVITGPIKSLRVGDTIIELPKESTK
jgi:hypothetical protein